MRKLLLLASLCMVGVLVFAQVALAQSRGPSGADGTYNCEDFDDQGQAQEFSLGDPQDENGLDEDGDGIVCEDLPTVTEDGIIPGEGEDAGGDQYAAVDQYDAAEVQYGAETGATAPAVTNLPDTGGVSFGALASFALPSLALLVAGGIFAARIVRRG